MNPASRLLIPFLFIFAAINIVVSIFWQQLLNFGVNNYVLLGANALILLLCIVVFFIQKKALANKNPNVFVRSVLSGMMIKMFSCVIAVLVYTLSSGDAFNKKAVFISMLLYLVYLAAEVIAISKLNKRENA